MLIVPNNHDDYFVIAMIDSALRFAVPFFIAILGYMTYEKYNKVKNWGEFIGRKFIYLGIPYILWSLLYISTPRVFPDYQDQTNFLSGIFFGDAEIHLYFMIAYFLFLLITPLVTFILRTFSKFTISLVLIFMIAAHLLLLLFVEIDIRSGNLETLYIRSQSKTPLHWLSFYSTGLLIALHKERVIKTFNRLKSILLYCSPFLLLLYLLGSLFFVVTQRNLYSYYTPVLYLMAVNAALIVTVMFLIFNKTRIFRLIRYFGKNSYPIYLSHILWIKLGYILMYPGIGVIDLNILLLLAIVSIGMSFLYSLIHQYVLQKLFFFIK